MTSLILIISGLVKLINFLVFIWCVCTWVPNIRWYEQPWKTLDQIVQPIIAPFRKIIPPIGNIDISAMVAILALQLAAAALESLVGQL